LQIRRSSSPVSSGCQDGFAILEKKQSSHVKSKAIKEALALASAWGDRDWNEVEAELDRIRHSSTPTPPFTFWNAICFFFVDACYDRSWLWTSSPPENQDRQSQSRI